MVLPEIEQLSKAKELAMNNSPQDMLPKVLETSLALYRSGNTSSELKLELAKFFSQLFIDIIDHEKISRTEKPFIASNNIECLWEMCKKERNPLVYKHCTFAFATCYSMLFDLVAKTSNQKLWDTMQEMKEFIISKWNTPYPLNYTTRISDSLDYSSMNDILLDNTKNIGSRLATGKFISEIIIVHTSANPSNISSSSNNNNDTKEISIASVPSNHPVITNKHKLDVEAKKLLDLLLNYLVEEPMMVSSMFIGIINCLSFIIKRRPQSAIRILSALLKFNIDAKFQIAGSSSLNYRLSKRFVERCYKNFVQFCLKAQLVKNSGQMTSIYTKLSKISQTLHIIGEETKSKGILNYDKTQYTKPITEKEKQKYFQLLQKKHTHKQSFISSSSSSNTSSSTNGNLSSNSSDDNSSNASQSIGNSSSQASVPAVDNITQQLMDLQNYTLSKNSISNFFNSSPIAFDNSYAAIYSLMNSKNSEQDVSKFSQDMMIKLCSEAFYNTDTSKLISGLSIIASRYTDLMTKTTSGNNAIENDRKRKLDSEDTRLENEPPNKLIKNEDEEDEEDEYNIDEDNLGIASEQNTIDYMKPKELSDEEKLKHLKRIVERLISIKNSNEGSEIISVVNKDVNPLEKVKLLQWENKESWLHILTRLATRGVSHDSQMSDIIRETLYNYFIEDINERISIAIEWLNEEWFHETISKDSISAVKKEESDDKDTSNYQKWSLKLLEGLIPYIENSHRRLFIRLISELPSFSQEHINMIRPICLDPARSSLGFQSLKFLIMFRPPVKSLIKLFLEDIKQVDDSIKEQSEAILTKFYQ